MRWFFAFCFRPFMFEVPRAFGSFDALFRRLGTRESPARGDYLQLLGELAVELGPGRALNVNEVAAVRNVLGWVAKQNGARRCSACTAILV